MKKLFALMFYVVSFCASAQHFPYADQRNVQPYGAYQQPDVCDYFADQLLASIVEANRQGQAVERTARYQALRQNQTFAFVNIPRTLSKVKDLEMSGASARDIYSLTRVLCGDNLRGNNN